MRALLRAELVKLATTRTAIGLVAGGAAVAALGALSTIMSGQPAELDRPLQEQTFFLLASINLSLFAVVLGIRGFTDEFRHGLIVPTLLVTPSRVRVVAARPWSSPAPVRRSPPSPRWSCSPSPSCCYRAKASSRPWSRPT